LYKKSILQLQTINYCIQNRRNAVLKIPSKWHMISKIEQQFKSGRTMFKYI